MYELASPNLPRKDILYIFFIALFGTLFGVLILVRIDQWQRDSLYIATEAALPEHEGIQKADNQIKESLTAGWKIYKNSKYSYTIRYPSNWSIVGYEESVMILPTIFREAPNVTITVNEKSVNKVKEEVINGVDNFLKNDIQITRDNRIFSGKEVLVLEYGTAIGGQMRTIIFQNGKYTYVISYSPELDPDSSIISTFVLE